ncbi:MAG: hypothetical protein JWP80_1042 [Pseudomonas sp.]|nr:hypothetical protein [Pseudomonas sp.]
MVEASGQLKFKKPKLKGYLWIGGILLTLWLGFYAVGIYKFTSEGWDMGNLNQLIGKGVAGISMTLLVAYFIHGMFNLHAFENKQKAADEANLLSATEEQRAETERTYALEIRGVGVAVGVWHQTFIWKKIKQKNNNFTSIYSQRAEDYDASLSSRESDAAINTRAAFRGAASEAVAIWPLPTFALGPPTLREEINAGNYINSGRNAATLASTLFLWQDSDNTTHAQNMIGRLFQFMDDNSLVPEALIASRDGDITRNGHRVAGTPSLKNGQVVPTIFESMTGLLVSRSDRMDYIRKFANHDGKDNQNNNTDQDKLWYFYWKRSPEFRKVYQDAKRAEGIEKPYGPSTMSSAFWHSQLPELWKTLSNRGPGEFQPSPWLPVRWSINQVNAFDAAPVLGYLHRPIKVSMRDENSKPLKPALQAKALQAAWVQALTTLPKGDLPVRVFYDSTDNADGEIALTNALHVLNVDGKGLELSNVEEGYNIGRRLGNTGVSSALVQINLATIASYHDGGASAVVYNGSDGSTTIQMVRPPDEARKAKNQENRGRDPFTYRSPK